MNDHPGPPTRRYISKLTRMFPDLVVHGFHRTYDGVTYVLFLESKMFPYWTGPYELGPVPATSLSGYLTKKQELKIIL